MAGIKRVKWTEDDTPPEWEEQYRDVDSDFDSDSDLDDPNSHETWTEEHSTRDITRERMDTVPYKPFEEYADPEWQDDGRQEFRQETSREYWDEEWIDTGRDEEWPDDGNQDTNDWMNVDIYNDLYPEEEVDQEKAAIRKKR